MTFVRRYFALILIGILIVVLIPDSCSKKDTTNRNMKNSDSPGSSRNPAENETANYIKLVKCKKVYARRNLPYQVENE